MIEQHCTAKKLVYTTKDGARTRIIRVQPDGRIHVECFDYGASTEGYSKVPLAELIASLEQDGFVKH